MADRERPLILITNDDGVRSPGLAAAAAAARPLGDLLIVAPRRQQTTMGRAFPAGRGVGRIEATTIGVEGDSVPAFAVSGSPAQAVAHGLLELADRRPALCISGVNYGENVGLSLTCSGTLGAALEAHSHGVPAIAVSLQTPLRLMRTRTYPALDWSLAVRTTRRPAKQALQRGLPPETAILNVNVPHGAAADCRLRLTRQSRMSASVFAAPGRRPLDAPFWLRTIVSPRLDQAEPDSDIRALLIDSMISITPLGWDMSANAAWNDSWLMTDREHTPA
jgi:5'-nucleotidase